MRSCAGGTCCWVAAGEVGRAVRVAEIAGCLGGRGLGEGKRKGAPFRERLSEWSRISDLNR